ncbi:MAG: DUF4416 family protein [Planctomycetes bacterium]|nr:DUF4416 family protein [Planctomycetota bacterium]
MARLRAPQPVKLFCGLLSSDVDLLQRARQLLQRRSGPIDLVSEIWPFDQTDYYQEEMGADLKRQFVSFEQPVPPDALPGIKHDTNAVEEEIAAQCAGLEITRPVNLDPGYLDLGKLVLATTKDRSHRLYIGQSMYAEVTLHFMNNRWQTWPWTYPDYHRAEYHEFFVRVRDRLRQQRRDLPDAFGESNS